jgi:Rieske Fe-S protein
MRRNDLRASAPLSEESSCGECPLVDRRSFVERAALALAATVASVALPRELMAAGIQLITPISESAEEKVYPMPRADGVQIDKSLDTIVVRHDGKIFVFNLACPHQNTAIRWQADKNRFECPKHKSHYTPAGVFTDGRATRGLDRFAIKRVADTIVVNLDVVYREDQKREQWTAAFVAIGS